MDESALEGPQRENRREKKRWRRERGQSGGRRLAKVREVRRELEIGARREEGMQMVVVGRAKAGRTLSFQAQPSPHDELQDSQGYIVSLCLKERKAGKRDGVGA